MRKQIVSVLATFVALAAMAVATHAQSANSRARFEVSVPFEFSIGWHETLPAGDYIVERMQHQARLISKQDGRSYMTPLAIAINSQMTQESSHLVFNRYGERYFLSQVWNSATNVGMELKRSREERSVEIAMNRAERETVTLLARR